jgi:hypothetical protein
MRFVHDKISHKYIVSTNGLGYTVRQWQGGPGQKLEMSNYQFKNFLETLKRNGWYEQSAKR